MTDGFGSSSRLNVHRGGQKNVNSLKSQAVKVPGTLGIAWCPVSKYCKFPSTHFSPDLHERASTFHQ